MGLELLFCFALIATTLHFHREISKLKKDIYLLARNPPAAKRALKNDSRYKKIK
tara:strand:- start:9624 stop:9785 length:162 start_codon:yes stop_codon:yes gene_type:complete